MSGVRLGRLLGQVCVLMSMVAAARAEEGAMTAGCFGEEMLLHVREQFAQYGPRSADREHFGFIYRIDGSIRSAVTHGDECRGQLECAVNPGFARRLIPAGARVLGEWHTHPRVGTSQLSQDDVRGAHANRHIRCYTAIYSTPDGTILRWDVDATTVAAAMASRTRVGNYRHLEVPVDSSLPVPGRYALRRFSSPHPPWPSTPPPIHDAARAPGPIPSSSRPLPAS
jgi:hypothetical protein